MIVNVHTLNGTQCEPLVTQPPQCDLAAWLSARHSHGCEPLSEAGLMKRAAQMANSLRVVHEAGYVHRVGGRQGHGYGLGHSMRL